jgi:hypothetical protein
MSAEPSTGITPQDLHAYFDDELVADQAKTVADVIEADPQLRLEFEQLGGLRSTVSASLESEAAAVPAARFEQIWDEIDRSIERDTRLQEEAERNASIWTRLRAAFRPVRMPVLAAAAAVVVTVVVLGPGTDPVDPLNPLNQRDPLDQRAEPNKTEGIASVDPNKSSAQTVAPAPAPTPEPEPTEIAVTDPDSEPSPKLSPMPVPENGEVEIHNVQFGGNGSISSSGTVTVLYVEDEEPTNSERSL